MPDIPGWTRGDVRPPEGVPPSELDAVESLLVGTLEQGVRRMCFPPPLERLFEQETGPSRRRHLMSTCIVWAACSLACTVCVLTGWPPVPGTSESAIFLGFGAAAPIVLAAALAVRMGLGPIPRELTVAIALWAGPALMTIIAAARPDADQDATRGAMILAILGVTVFVRLRFWFAGAVCATLAALHVAAPLLHGYAPEPDVPLLLATVVALAANYSIEREHRSGYLHRLFVRVQSRKLEEVAVHWQALSDRDPLTGIENRRSLDRKLGALHERGEPYAIILIDVDGFKAFNDEYGHQHGDECLRRVAAILRASLRRATDSAARIGGEEFAVVLPGADEDSAWPAAERIRRAVLELGIPHGASPAREPVVSISAGIAATAGGEPPTAVIARADSALYGAKSAGRNRVVIARPERAEAPAPVP